MIASSPRVLLAQAPLGRPDHLTYPLGLACLAGALAQAAPGRFEVAIVDPNLAGGGGGDPDLADIAGGFEPDVVGISLRNIDTQMRRDPFTYFPAFQRFAARVRERWPKARIVAGGPGFSLFPREILERTPALDCGLILEGEAVFAALLDHLDDPGRVPGAVFRGRRGVEIVPPAPFLPFSELAAPRYDLFSPRPYAGFPGAVGVQTKRGCALSCAYCTYPRLNGSTVRQRDPEAVVDEICRLRDEHGVGRFQFVDAVFNLPRRHAEEILRGMVRRAPGLAWSGYFHEADFDQPFAELALAAGCREFQFSPDGHSPATLKRLGKQATAADVRRVLDLAGRLPGFRFSLGYFWSPPGQDWATWLALIRLMARCKVQFRRSCAGFILAVPRIEPGTEIERIAREQGVLAPETSLLAATPAELERVFYVNPETPGLNRMFDFYRALWQLRARLRAR